MAETQIARQSQQEQMLARLEDVCASLASIQSVGELKQMRDGAEAIRVWARSRDQTLEVQNRAAELKLRFERRLGELLRGTVRHEGGRPSKLRHPAAVFATLPEGVNRDQSRRWQKISVVPEEKFASYVEQRKADREEITEADLLRLATQLDVSEKREAVSVATAAARAELEATAPDDRLRLADFRDVAAGIPDGAVSLIFTDPPYDRDSLPLYDDLGKIAARVLCEGGSLITYLGNLHLLEVGKRLEAAGLKFLWPLANVQADSNQQMREFGIICRWKPLLWFVRGTNRLDPNRWAEDMIALPQEKGGHPWQQAEKTAAYYIDRLTNAGDLVFDPFCGSGTTAAAAATLGREWLTCDTDPVAVRTARERVND